VCVCLCLCTCVRVCVRVPRREASQTHQGDKTRETRQNPPCMLSGRDETMIHRKFCKLCCSSAFQVCGNITRETKTNLESQEPSLKQNKDGMMDGQNRGEAFNPHHITHNSSTPTQPTNQPQRQQRKRGIESTHTPKSMKRPTERSVSSAESRCMVTRVTSGALGV
jgi:hypothetical protein